MLTILGSSIYRHSIEQLIRPRDTLVAIIPAPGAPDSCRPAGFAATCILRKPTTPAFFLDPPDCCSRESSHRKYRGETGIPLSGKSPSHLFYLARLFIASFGMTRFGLSSFRRSCRQRASARSVLTINCHSSSLYIFPATCVHLAASSSNAFLRDIWPHSRSSLRFFSFLNERKCSCLVVAVRFRSFADLYVSMSMRGLSRP